MRVFLTLPTLMGYGARHDERITHEYDRTGSPYCNLAPFLQAPLGSLGRLCEARPKSSPARSETDPSTDD